VGAIVEPLNTPLYGPPTQPGTHLPPRDCDGNAPWNHAHVGGRNAAVEPNKSNRPTGRFFHFERSGAESQNARNNANSEGKIMSDFQIPKIGYGTWNREGKAAYDGVLKALELGYRHIDTAEGYHNEEFVGNAIADSGVPRNEIFLTTKVSPESFGPGQIRSHVEASLQKLKVDQVDLLLLHYPSINDEYDIEDYMAQFAAVHDAGLTRHLGVSNFTKKYIDKALALLGDKPIRTNQVEIHVYLSNHPIVDHCRELGIATTAYSPLARGAVSDDPVLTGIGQEIGATAGQVALAYLLSQDHIVIPSSANPQRIADNLAAANLQLTSQQITAIKALDQGRRLIDGPWCPAWDT
jgi:2,5-diketo-D-gluconate reductase B